MSTRENARKLREKLDKAVEKDRPREAVDILLQLEQLESDQARWPQRRGDIHRRQGQKKDAIEAYLRAMRLYDTGGFIARSLAVAKMIVDLDPSRTDVLASVNPQAARRLVKPRRSLAPPVDFSGSVPQLSSLAPGPGAAQADESLELDIDVDLSEIEVAPTPEHDRSADELAHLPAFPLFADVPREALLDLVRGATLIELEPGQTVIKQGARAEEMYAIVEGAVRVQVPGL